jgi:hypothetical protein
MFLAIVTLFKSLSNAVIEAEHMPDESLLEAKEYVRQYEL